MKLPFPLRSRSLFCLVSLSAAACTTTGNNNARQNQTLNDKGHEKAGDKASDSEPAPPPVSQTEPTTAIPATGTVTPPSLDDQLAFVKAHKAPGAPFGEPEHQFVDALPKNPAPGSVTEAAVALGIFGAILNPRVDAVTFKEGELGQTAPAEGDAPKSISIEQMARDRGVNLADALVENPLLSGYGIAKQAHMALQQSAASPEFRTEITLALKKQASQWSEFGQALNTDNQAPKSPPPEDPGVAPNPADLHGGDAVLTEAQALADRGNYVAAIKKANTIGDGNAMRPQAQEKIREFSRIAVQELRTKAFTAFQSAAPVTDNKTKAGYLKQAKTYLEEAIKNFPEAPQLPTVRDNLRAISRDLEKLETEKGH